MKKNRSETVSPEVDKSRRQFLKHSSTLTFTALVTTALPMSALLTGCDATFYKINFINWSENIQAKDMLATKPTNESDAVTIVQWAAENGYKVRPLGEMHNWSPLIITQGTTKDDKILLVDTSLFNQLEMVKALPDYGVVRAGSGTLAEDLYRFLSDNRTPGGASQGYAFQNTPAPGDITIAGILAINGHGTGVEYNNSNEDPNFHGSLSNTVLSLRAIVYNRGTGKYEAKTFHRDEEDTDVFLTHMGRLLITEVTLQAVPNFNLRCRSYTNVSWKELFHENANNSALTVASILDRYGRMETIWFPFTEYPWLKIWENSPTKPPESKATTGPYNYAFADQIPVIGSRLIKSIVNDSPNLVPSFGQFQYCLVDLALDGKLTSVELKNAMSKNDADSSELDLSTTPASVIRLNDLWGPAWHTLLYVKKSTLRVTANGYAIHLPRADVQKMIHDFVQKYQSLAKEYAQRGLYPMAGPMEIRVTGLEETGSLKTRNGQKPKPPAISALTKSSTSDSKVDTAVWLDLLTLPGAPASNALYREVEQWLYDRYPTAEMRSEWSKGWGYTDDKGPWTDSDILRTKIPAAFAKTPRSFSSTVRIMQEYDPMNLYSNAMLDELLQ